MKLVLVANIASNSTKHSSMLSKFSREIQAQLENSFQVGWKAEDIILLTNFDFECNGVRNTYMEFPTYCLTGSKMFAVEWLFKNNLVTETLCVHDLDLWQNVWFDEPEFSDVGISTYSTPKFNGGIVFWGVNSSDIVYEITKTLHLSKDRQEEPTINNVLKSSKFGNRVTVLETGYNIGSSGFVERYIRAKKPIKCAHLKTPQRIAWMTHVTDRNNIGVNCRSVDIRLEKLLIKYFYPNPAMPPPPHKKFGELYPFKPDRTISDKNPNGQVIKAAKDPLSEKNTPVYELTELDPLPPFEL